MPFERRVSTKLSDSNSDVWVHKVRRHPPPADCGALRSWAQFPLPEFLDCGVTDERGSSFLVTGEGRRRGGVVPRGCVVDMVGGTLLCVYVLFCCLVRTTGRKAARVWSNESLGMQFGQVTTERRAVQPPGPSKPFCRWTARLCDQHRGL